MTTTFAQPSKTAETVNYRPYRAAQIRSMCIAYLTTEYPKASHTFIRRELLELERRGHRIVRLAIRDCESSIVDVLDREEHEKTTHLLRQPKMRILLDAFRTMMRRPRGLMRAIAVMWRLHRRSDRGLFRHLAYLIEAAALLPIVQREGVQHIHVHFGTNAASVALLMRQFGGPTYSVAIHGPDEFDAPLGHSLCEKVRGAAFVTAISDYCSAQILRWADVNDWWKVNTVRCAVGQSFIDDATPVMKNIRTFLCIGRLTAQKGQMLLLEAMARLHDDGHAAQLVLAGDGELRGDIESRVAQLGLEDCVRITGWVDETQVRRLLCESRALVLPSFAEGLPVVIMEAMAMQRPVISTNVAAISELVTTGETGWLIPPANIDALSAAMQEALTSGDAELTELGVRGRQRVLMRHSAMVEGAKLESLIASVQRNGESR